LLSELHDGLEVMAERAEVTTLFSGERHGAQPRAPSARRASAPNAR
jgi:hypothetical protein